MSKVDELYNCVGYKHEHVHEERKEVPYLLVLEVGSRANHIGDTFTAFTGSTVKVLVEFVEVGQGTSIEADAQEVLKRYAANHHFQLVHEAVNTCMLNVKFLKDASEVVNGAEQDHNAQAGDGHLNRPLTDLKLHPTVKAITSLDLLLVYIKHLVDLKATCGQRKHTDDYKCNINPFSLLGYSRFGRVSKLLWLFESATPGHLDDLNCLKQSKLNQQESRACHRALGDLVSHLDCTSTTMVLEIIHIASILHQPQSNEYQTY